MAKQPPVPMEMEAVEVEEESEERSQAQIPKAPAVYKPIAMVKAKARPPEPAVPPKSAHVPITVPPRVKQAGDGDQAPKPKPKLMPILQSPAPSADSKRAHDGSAGPMVDMVRKRLKVEAEAPAEPKMPPPPGKTGPAKAPAEFPPAPPLKSPVRAPLQPAPPDHPPPPWKICAPPPAAAASVGPAVSRTEFSVGSLR